MKWVYDEHNNTWALTELPKLHALVIIYLLGVISGSSSTIRRITDDVWFRARDTKGYDNIDPRDENNRDIVSKYLDGESVHITINKGLSSSSTGSI